MSISCTWIDTVAVREREREGKERPPCFFFGALLFVADELAAAMHVSFCASPRAVAELLEVDCSENHRTKDGSRAEESG